MVSLTRKQRLLDDNVSSPHPDDGIPIITNWEIFDVLCEINARLNSIERNVKLLMEDRYARR